MDVRTLLIHAQVILVVRRAQPITVMWLLLVVYPLERPVSMIILLMMIQNLLLQLPHAIKVMVHQHNRLPVLLQQQRVSLVAMAL